MAFIPLGGKSRRYLNTATGEEISRRQYLKLMEGVSFEEKAKRNKAKDLGAALARPARGRAKAANQQEIERRLQLAQDAAEQKRSAQLQKKAAASAKRVRVKTIRPQLLKSGHRAVRIAFNTYPQFQDLRRQMLAQKAPNGKRLITSYGLGISGIDERTGREISATLVTLQSPRVNISEEDLEEMTEDFISEKMYFLFSHYWLHLHYDPEYSESRRKKKLAKNLPRRGK